MLTIRLSPDTKQRLQTLAIRSSRTKTSCVREAILNFIEDMEDSLIAEERLNSSVKRWTLEELEQEVDLES